MRHAPESIVPLCRPAPCRRGRVAGEWGGPTGDGIDPSEFVKFIYNFQRKLIVLGRMAYRYDLACERLFSLESIAKVL